MKIYWLNLVTASAFGLLSTLPLRSACAEPTSADKSLATQLFKEGRLLLEQGHTPQACRKLEESQRLDPGGGTLLNLALCHEREGRTATAWTEFTEALGIAKRDERVQRVEFARMHISQLEPSLSRLFIQVPTAADLPDLEIKRDGSVLGRGAWGSAMPVDPGEHLIEASAPGKVPWKLSVNLGSKGDSKTLVVPILENALAPSSVSSAPTSSLAAATGVAASPVALNTGKVGLDSASSPGAGGSRITGAVGWIALGLGVAAGGAGTYFALRAISLKHDADAACPNDRCTADGARQNNDAIQSANFATAGFAVGAVGVALGALLLATSSTSSHSAASSETPARSDTLSLASAGFSLGPAGANLSVSGRF